MQETTAYVRKGLCLIPFLIQLNKLDSASEGPNPVQLSSSIMEREDMFPYILEAVVTVPPPQSTMYTLLAQLHQHWHIGL